MNKVATAYNRATTNAPTAPRKYLTTTKSGQSDYARTIRGAVHGLWAGVITRTDFVDMMQSAITRGMTRAFYDGAKDCGILPNELTLAENAVLLSMLSTEIGFIDSFATEIIDNAKANKRKFTPLANRAKLYINRYQDTRNRARSLVCADQKLVWVLGATEQHCRTCFALNGKVKRASFWEALGLRPQNPPNPFLECQGWRCDCRLEVTQAALTPGILPNLP